MKLYIWDDVLTDYTAGLMFAVANSVEEARDLLREDCYDCDDLQKEPEVHDLTSSVSRVIWGGG